jgi:hypothetical protein
MQADDDPEPARMVGAPGHTGDSSQVLTR